jgi:threonine/homoserine/homoserine lactone efflux protein
MSDLIVELLGLAVIVAASPIVLIPMVVLLLGSRGTTVAVAYLGAVASGTTVAIAVFLTLADLIDRTPESTTASGWLRLLVGSALLVVALRQWLTRARKSAKPAWLSALDSATAGTAFRLGLLVSLLNPKVLGVAAAAAVLIAAEGVSLGRQVLAAAVFILGSVAGITVILLGRIVGGAAGEAALQRLGSWLDRHSTALSVAVLAILGVLLVLDGAATSTLCVVHPIDRRRPAR